jgi:hypothetical protein
VPETFRSCPVCAGAGVYEITCEHCNGKGAIDTTLYETAKAALAAYRKYVADDDLDQLQVAMTELQDAVHASR